MQSFIKAAVHSRHDNLCSQIAALLSAPKHIADFDYQKNALALEQHNDMQSS